MKTTDACMLSLSPMRRAGTIAVCCMLTALLCGCEATTQYRVLSFLFDGVPPPGKTEAAAGRKTKTKPEVKEKVRLVEHGPYAAKQCEGCHLRGSNRLLVPIEQLCYKCHVIDLEKKYIHGPLSSGGCKICHHPHSSRYPYLLVAEAKDFCFYCHSREDVAKNEVHSGPETDCILCHDAHSSDIEYLLKGS